MEAINVGQLSNHFLKQFNTDLAKEMKGDCVFINCPMQPPLDDEFRVVVEEIVSLQDSNKRHLIVMLETMGGYMETVERMVSVMRTHYSKVSFVIPNHAYSAGTVLALSGDNIWMDYYSVLGPIDPQYLDGSGKSLPGTGYLAKYEELVEKINESKSKNTHRAELAYLISKFDPALLFHIEQGIDNGKTLIKEWLPKYKFRDWKKTEHKRKIVTSKMRINRAEKIATTLGNAKKWHSYGRGITMKELRGAEIKLMIDNFGENTNLNHLIRNYHGLCADYYGRIPGYIHSKIGIRRVFNEKNS